MSVQRRKHLVGALMAAALFAGVTLAMRSRATAGFDREIRNRVHERASPAMTATARGVATLGSPIVLSVLFGIAMLAFRRARWKRAAVLLAAVMAGAVVLDNGFKSLFRRVRPEPFFGKLPWTSSFPSGHALFSLCFYGVVACVLATHVTRRRAKVQIWVAAALLIAAIGLSRVYLGVHYPTDVIAGHLCAAFVINAVLATTRSDGRSSGTGARSRPRLPRENPA